LKAHVRRFDDHFPAFHAARAGHDGDLVAADGDAAHLDYRRLVGEIPAGQLVGLHHAHGALDAVHHLKGRVGDQMLVGADDADDGARLAPAQMHLVAQLFHPLDDAFDFRPFGAQLHHNDHEFLSFRSKVRQVCGKQVNTLYHHLF
jgi:hypothetical protein